MTSNRKTVKNRGADDSLFDHRLNSNSNSNSHIQALPHSWNDDVVAGQILDSCGENHLHWWICWCCYCCCCFCYYFPNTLCIFCSESNFISVFLGVYDLARFMFNKHAPWERSSEHCSSHLSLSAIKRLDGHTYLVLVLYVVMYIFCCCCCFFFVKYFIVIFIEYIYKSCLH